MDSGTCERNGCIEGLRVGRHRDLEFGVVMGRELYEGRGWTQPRSAVWIGSNPACCRYDTYG
jgi:hypothetical protein